MEWVERGLPAKIEWKDFPPVPMALVETLNLHYAWKNRFLQLFVKASIPSLPRRSCRLPEFLYQSLPSSPAPTSPKQIVGSRSHQWNHCIECPIEVKIFENPQRIDYTPVLSLYNLICPGGNGDVSFGTVGEGGDVGTFPLSWSINVFGILDGEGTVGVIFVDSSFN